MVAAMKSGDAARLSALRMLKAALMKRKVDSPKPIDEPPRPRSSRSSSIDSNIEHGA